MERDGVAFQLIATVTADAVVEAILDYFIDIEVEHTELCELRLIEPEPGRFAFEIPLVVWVEAGMSAGDFAKQVQDGHIDCAQAAAQPLIAVRMAP